MSLAPTDRSQAEPTFDIGPKRVGPSGSVYVIAEAGVNHDGDVAVARDLVAEAAQAGADAIKFQVFSADRLVTRDAPAAEYQRRAGEATTQHEMLKRLELSRECFQELADLARERAIEFLATPFAVEDLRFLLSLKVAAIKIASTDIVNVPLLEAAVGAGLPVIASTGAADIEEIREAVRFFDKAGAGPLALLHCVSSYPTPDDQANLAGIATLARAFGRVAGYSDHTESVTMGAYATAAGARVIEKHFTLDRRRPGPDHAFSLEPRGLAEYVHHARHAARLLGGGRIGPTDAQREVRSLARGSVVAAREIAPDEVIVRDMLTVKRPGTGIAPSEIDKLVGRRAVRRITVDAIITWGDVR